MSFLASARSSVSPYVVKQLSKEVLRAMTFTEERRASLGAVIEAAGKKLKFGTSTFEVIRTYKTKMDATGPIGRDFLRTIPRGGGGAIAKKLSGGYEAGHYFVAMSAAGEPVGKPMWMSPMNLKRAMRYEESQDFSEAGSFMLFTEEQRAYMKSFLDIPTLNEATSSARTFSKYLQKAEGDFLRVAEKHIRKQAGSRGDVRVVSGRSVAWLEYEGTDTSDMPLEFSASVSVSGTSDVTLYTHGIAHGGKFSKDIKFKTGVLTPFDVVLEWRSRMGF
jgi:hypothetical protein